MSELPRHHVRVFVFAIALKPKCDSSDLSFGEATVGAAKAQARRQLSGPAEAVQS